MIAEPAAPAPGAYFEHDADIGIVGRGATLEACFESAAAAMFAIMCDPARIAPAQAIGLEFEEADVELALVTWLNRLLAAARAQSLALSRFELAREGSRWRGRAWGAPWEEATERGTEVKGATLTMLTVKQASGGWEARCVVDV